MGSEVTKETRTGAYAATADAESREKDPLLAPKPELVTVQVDQKQVKAATYGAMKMVHGAQVPFVTGMGNLLITCVIFGRYPEYFFLWHAFQCFFFLPVVVMEKYRRKVLTDLPEFCWPFNFAAWIYMVVAVVDTITIDEDRPYLLHQVQPYLLSEGMRKVMLRIIFVCGSGPVALSIPLLGFGLVFHELQNLVSFFIHISPMTTMWCLRWNRPAVEAAWPGLFPIPDDTTFLELWAAGTAFYGAVWVCYMAWMLISGLSLYDKGYKPLFWYHLEKTPAARVIAGIDANEKRYGMRVLGLLRFMIVHAAAVSLGNVVGALLYFSVYAHSAALAVIMFFAVSYGGAYYRRSILPLSELARDVGAQVDDHLEAKGQRADLPDDVAAFAHHRGQSFIKERAERKLASRADAAPRSPEAPHVKHTTSQFEAFKKSGSGAPKAASTASPAVRSPATGNTDVAEPSSNASWH